MFEADAVGVSQDDQGRRRDRADVLLRPGEVGRVELLELLDQLGEVTRVGRNLKVGLLDRRACEELIS